MIVLQQIGHALRLRGRPLRKAPRSKARSSRSSDCCWLSPFPAQWPATTRTANWCLRSATILEPPTSVSTCCRPQDQPPLRQLFRDYVNSRLHLYDRASRGRYLRQTTDQLQQEIWEKSVAAAATPGANPDATKLLLPAVNAMIDITSTRENAFNLHPPEIIFLLLFILSGGRAFLAGYGMTDYRNEAGSIPSHLRLRSPSPCMPPWRSNTPPGPHPPDPYGRDFLQLRNSIRGCSKTRRSLEFICKRYDGCSVEISAQVWLGGGVHILVINSGSSSIKFSIFEAA